MNDDNFEIIIPEINTKNGLKLCRGNLKIYIQSLRLFVSSIPASLEKMRSVTENSMKIYLTSVHNLKGMCDYIGAEEIRKSAKQLEDMADACDLKGILELNGNLIRETEIIISCIKTWLDNNSGRIDTILSCGQNNG